MVGHIKYWQEISGNIVLAERLKERNKYMAFRGLATPISKRRQIRVRKAARNTQPICFSSLIEEKRRINRLRLIASLIEE